MSLFRAFTLIELLVVMAIIGLMTSIVIINYSGQKTKDLEEQAVLQFVSDLRRAQNMAMAVVDCGGVQDKYGIAITGAKKYRLTCDSQDKQLEVSISGNDVFFLPIRADLGRTTIQTESAPRTVVIEGTTITIRENGQIIW